MKKIIMSLIISLNIVSLLSAGENSLEMDKKYYYSYCIHQMTRSNGNCNSWLTLAKEDLILEELKRHINRDAINAVSSFNLTLLHCACALNSFELVQFLVENGAEINKQTARRQTPLHKTTSLEIIKYLIAHGADIALTDDEGNTPAAVIEKSEMSDEDKAEILGYYNFIMFTDTCFQVNSHN